jgi:hypothetical protein
MEKKGESKNKEDMRLLNRVVQGKTTERQKLHPSIFCWGVRRLRVLVTIHGRFPVVSLEEVNVIEKRVISIPWLLTIRLSGPRNEKGETEKEEDMRLLNRSWVWKSQMVQGKADERLNARR